MKRKKRKSRMKTMLAVKPQPHTVAFYKDEIDGMEPAQMSPGDSNVQQSESSTDGTIFSKVDKVCVKDVAGTEQLLEQLMRLEATKEKTRLFTAFSASLGYLIPTIGSWVGCLITGNGLWLLGWVLANVLFSIVAMSLLGRPGEKV